MKFIPNSNLISVTNNNCRLAIESKCTHSIEYLYDLHFLTYLLYACFSWVKANFVNSAMDDQNFCSILALF